MEMQGTRTAKTILKKNKVGRLALHDFKTYHAAVCTRQRGTGIRIDMYIDGTELSPEINPHIYGQLILDKGAKTIQ